MKKYRDMKTGELVVEVEDLSFVKEREHSYNWFQRHYHHHRLRHYLKRADKVYVSDNEMAVDVVRYYFVPKDRIVVR